MGIWFRKENKQKYHLATYGGSIAMCGRDTHIAARYAKDKVDITSDEVINSNKYCQACVNAVKRFRKYVEEAEAKYQETLKVSLVPTLAIEGKDDH